MFLQTFDRGIQSTLEHVFSIQFPFFVTTPVIALSLYANKYKNKIRVFRKFRDTLKILHLRSDMGMQQV